MDNPATESSALSVDGAAAAFAAMMETAAEPEKKEGEEAEAPATEEVAEEAPEPNAQEEGGDAPIVVEVDGKPVELTKEQIAEAYKSGLRQADYTKKTMEAAETRKAAEAETAKARAEREAYAGKLQENTLLLQAVIKEQEQTNWQQLIDSDPVEFLKQQHLFQQRQAALQKAQGELAQLHQLQQAEAQEARANHVRQQQELLLAKLPDWKDEKKAAAEKSALRAFLQAQDFTEKEINEFTDHRAIVLSRKAMLYDQMIAKAQAATKKVTTLPQKVERPGTGTAPDQRTSAFKALARTGSVEDAARAWAQIL